MKTIRYGTFETNSSSTHSLLILSDEEQDLLDKEELYIASTYDYDLLTKEEYKQKMISEMTDFDYYDSELNFEENLAKFKDSDAYGDNQNEFPRTLEELIDYETSYLDHDVDRYTTKSGDQIVIHSFYGYNG